MMFSNLDKAGLYNRFYSATGAFSLPPKTPCFYRQPGDDTMQYLPEPNAYTVFMVHINRDFINSRRGGTTLIPIAPPPKVTASQHPAVSSLMAYPTPAH